MAEQPNPALHDFATHLRALNPTHSPEFQGGRGIVVAAGGAQIFTNAYVLISLLRRTLGCTLPIELWHFGPQELSPTMAALLHEMEVTVVDALPRTEAAGIVITDGWQLKPFALLQSGFAEVLMLDADQVPVRDPAELFEAPGFSETGAVFWPDIVGLRSDNPVWAGLGLEPLRPEMSIESGQMLVDKRRHWRALTIAMEMSRQRGLVDRYIYGDKDLFLLAWLLAEDRYTLVPHLPLPTERGLHQRDFAGAPLFQHRTGNKFAYATTEPATDGVVHLEACNAALQTLRQRWNGRIFWPPDRSLPARSAEASLAAQGRFRLVVVDSEQVELELWPFGEIGTGRSAYRQNWWCEERQGNLELLLRDDERITYRLRPEADGTWRGERLLYGEATAMLLPRTLRPAPPAAPGLVDQLLAAIGFPTVAAAEWQRFCASIELLSRVDPSVLVRMEEIAATHAPEAAGHLTGLVASIRAGRSFRAAKAPPGTLETYYRRRDLDDPA